MEGQQQSTNDDLKYNNEFSRLLGVLGPEALAKLQSNSVLLLGCKGLGVEIAKNIVLMGVKALTICDTDAVELRDLSSNFFLSESDIGKPRASCIRSKLQELNDRCSLSIHDGPITEELIIKYRIVVMTDNKSRQDMERFSEAAHRAGVTVIASDCWGVFGYIFVDCGENHEITDRTGERPKTGYLASFNRHEGEGHCVCIDRHDLEDGMTVRISEVQGIPSLNGQEFKVETKGPFIFSLGKIPDHQAGEYIKGGLFEEVKKPTHMSFESLGNQLSKPINIWEKFVPTDGAKYMDAPQQMLLMLALLEFRAAHEGALPRNHDAHDAQEVIDMAKAINGQVRHVEDQIDEQLLTRLCKVSRGDLGPMAATFGGIIAQEVIKASSGKYTPLRQWCFFDAREVLVPSAKEADVDLADYVEQGTRYDGQVAVFGNAFQAKLMDLQYFLVGAGAIGCEMLKNWACMGLGCGPKGSLIVTDNDIIEISNLNRQFLYRPWNVSKPKSETSAAAAQGMNPAMKIKAYTTKVCPETEDVFNDEFWTHLDGVCNALDNIHARLYVDGKCAFFGKSLLESGTLGTKGNTQVMVPGVTQTYGETTDPEPKEVAKCLLHSFPSNIEHCLQWARELLFEGEFVTNAEEVNNFLSKPDYVAQLTDQERKKKLEILGSILVDRQSSFDDCIVWARNLFEEMYVRKPRQLIHTFPRDAKDSAGQPFWQGTRRPPTPTPFDPTNSTHIDFIVASTFLRAYTLKLLPTEFKPSDMDARRAHIAKVVAGAKVSEWTPKDNVKIAFDPEKEKEENDKAGSGVSEEDERLVAHVMSKLPAPSTLQGWKMNVLDFEKDDDRNFHIDFVHAAASLRAVAYEIPTVSRLQAKLIAGKIIPAIVTTTAVVAGLVCFDLFKLVLGLRELEYYRNYYVNLAIPLFQAVEAVKPASYKYRGTTYTTWDSVKIQKGDITVGELIKVLQAEHNIDPYTIELPVGSNVQTFFRGFGDWSTELETKVSVLAQQHLKLAPQQRCFKLMVTPKSADDEDDDNWMDVGPEKEESPDKFPPVWFYYK